MNDEGLADVEAANPFRLPRLHPGIGFKRGQPSPLVGKKCRFRDSANRWPRHATIGGVSVYGLRRFPVTLYKEQWTKLPGHG
jgi:hypothetical protein